MASKFIILSAPSGSGKSTLVSYLLQKIDSLSFSVSSTTRKRRKTEQHGIHYYFITKNEFDNHINKNDFIEWEQVYNNDFKGTLKSEIKRLTDKNKNVIFDVDVIGGLNLKKYFGKDALSIYIDVPNLKSLEDRLNLRGTDLQENIKERLNKAKIEASQKNKFDVVIMNENIDSACEKISSTVNKFLSK